ncbi:MAG: BON domain-containing protein [Sediminibacterium magnilacihabitans]|jgi:osmotically-inducible protein OsmY|nr:BON domain-containing protein [Sediminibacterium magnilacihabitans]PQV60315.1 osmotically-inducible protein OsmY [Sediminibacterium magnilacihabitans]
MKTDIQIQKDVMEELKWDPSLNAAEIGVTVKNGIVTLSGQVNSYAKKMAAEKDVKKISGVKAVAEDIQLRVFPSFQKSDSEIAEAVLNALKWNSNIQEEKIKIKVENGVVQLEGEVEWEYQRTNVKSTIENLTGVKSVLNLITIKPKLTASGVHQKIIEALYRSATVDAENIIVQTIGSKVVLSGKVRSLAEKEDAELAAWNAPGVISVENDLRI